MERLKQKVASSSSRVIASLQQAATGTFQSTSQSSSRLAQEQQSANQVDATQTNVGPDQVGSRLMADSDATAHLTEEEREILLQVFKKEAEFERSTIIQMGASNQCQLDPLELNHQQAELDYSSQQQEYQNRLPNRRSSQRTDRTLNPAQRQTSSSSGSIRQHQQQHYQYQSPSFGGSSTASTQASPSPVTTFETSNSSSTTAASSSFHLASSARSSATPTSRPASSVFAGTPINNGQITGRRRESSTNRAGSSCSSSAPTVQQSQQQQQPLGQCRICRKLILTSEPCHLCSNCNQFICEDCASYSASDQHWMCSSCRRRATKPAIPADALRELGLNQNSSPVRRMTLRLNQTDLRLELGKGSSESNASSNSSSGCSSMSTAPPTHQVAPSISSAGNTRPSLQQQQVRQTIRSSGDERLATVQQQQPQPQQQPNNNKSHDKDCDTSNYQKQKQLQRRGSSIDPSASNQPPNAVTAQKTQSNPVAANALPQESIQAKGNRLPAAQCNSGNSSSSGNATSSHTPIYASSRQNSTGGSGTQARSVMIDRFQQQQQQHRQQIRRASVAVSDASMRGRGTGKPQAASATAGASTMMMTGRKQSSGNFSVMQATSGALSGPSSSSLANNLNYAFEQAHSGGGRSGPTESLMLSAGHRRQSIQQQQQQQQQPAHSNNNHHQHQQQQFIMGQPRTMITASSELSMSDVCESMRESGAGSARGSIVGGALIPIPPDQIHLRRLSDQSNLVRRSSIIADTIDVVSMQHRNRSHSNIDTVSYAFYQPQFQAQPLDYSDENLRDSQRQYQQQQQQRRDSVAIYGANPADYVGPQRQQQQQQQMSSIITSYSQKHRRSSDDLHTDSSSDIDEDLQVGQTNLEMDDEQPNEYFAPPRGLDYVAADQQGCFVDSLTSAGIPIPSVSVSEFTSSQQRLNQMHQQQQQQQPQPPLMQLEQLMTSPIQINVAIEQAIQQQQQRQDLVQLYLPASDMLAQQQQHQHQLPVGYSALAPRRGSSGRILPQIPGDQSQSLLDLPHTTAQPVSSGPVAAAYSGGGGRSSLSNGSMNRLSGLVGGGDQQRLCSTLDLPSASQTIRRASAPEGQNIKIVVDDMDGAMMRSNGCCSGSMMMVIDPSGALVIHQQQQQQPNGNDQQQHHHHHHHHHHQHHQNQQRHHQYGKQGELFERLVLYRDDSFDPNTNMARGFGLQVMGGKIDETGKLQACVVWILAGGPADKVGLKYGDKIIEWDGKCLVNMSYEQVADVIESSANIAELLVKPAHRIEVQPGSASVVRSQRRLSHQTERDLKKMLQQQNGQPARASEGLKASATTKTTSQQQHWQQSGGQQQLEASDHHQHQTRHLLDTAASLQQPQHHQQAISAGNSPLRSGTGRKLPQIPGGGGSGSGRFQDGPLCDNGPTISQMKLNSSSTSQLEQQTGGGYYAAGNNSQQHQKTFLGQLQPEQRTLSAQNGSLQSGEQPQQQMLWYQQPRSQPQQSAYKQQQHFGPHNPQPTSGHYNQEAAFNLSAPNQVEVFGLIGLQVNVDERAAQLEISVLSAINLNLPASQDYFVRLKILPESNRFKACKTLPRSDLNWKETFLFQNFPIDQINRMAVEIGVWLHDEAPRLSTQLAQPICEAMIPIQSARERNTDFWPLRQPPSSPQTRRKSLNDLLETHHRQQDDRSVVAQLSAGYQNSNNNLPVNWPTPNSKTIDSNKQQHLLLQYQQASQADGEMAGCYVRGRSSSNRNLPDTSKLRAQPRRASDEVAGQRLSSRLSPAVSRRSISVINVGPDAALSRPSSRLGSQSNLIKSQRRDSSVAHHQQQQQQQQQQQYSSSGDSPVLKYGSPKGSTARVDEPGRQSTTVQPSCELTGITPAGRRSSLAGINNMIGYASQKCSLSDASSEQMAPVKATGLVSSRRPSQVPPSGGGSQRGTSSTANGESKREPQEGSSQRQASAGQKQSPSTTPVKSRAGSAGSRRGSVVDGSGAPKLERKGSFAMLTLRKLKRTMSLTKGAGDQQQQEEDAPDSNQTSRRSSSDYEADVGEDVGLTRRLIGQTVDYVGKLKLSFILTKGQLEIDVISAHGLKYDLESSLGLYVKMYLKGRNKSNKRKTRLVQPWESPIFKQLIKYDGCLVDNKSLEVSLWQKQGGLKGKIPIGFTEVRLSELSLNQLQTSWYNLRPMDMMCSSSLEE